LKRWINVIAAAMGSAAVATVGTLTLATRRWNRVTDEYVRQLGRAAQPSEDEASGTVRLAMLESLPAPVLRYFRAVLHDGQSCVRSARVVQTGEFLMPSAEDGWRRFDATQTFTTAPPGFVWDAHIRLFRTFRWPVVNVCDAYLSSEASMTAAISSVVSLVNERGDTHLNAAALQRYLGEAVWFPTALLPSAELTWCSIDDSRALATLTEGTVSVSLEFEFAQAGEIVSCYTPARYRAGKGDYEITPWGGSYRGYEERGEMRVPLDVEAYWNIEGREQPYFRGRLADIAYGFAVE